jgi:hypothetical protein
VFVCVRACVRACVCVCVSGPVRSDKTDGWMYDCCMIGMKHVITHTHTHTQNDTHLYQRDGRTDMTHRRADHKTTSVVECTTNHKLCFSIISSKSVDVVKSGPALLGGRT